MTNFAGKRVLPYRPHLDHLRKQAKARLAEMRTSEPDARLADAQRALAEEYGFSAWGMLRAEVVRLTGTQHDLPFRTRRRRTPLVIRYGERDHQDSHLEQATHAESQTAFFLAGSATNVGVLFVLIAILTSLWVFSSALPGW